MNVHDLIIELTKYHGREEVYLHAPTGPAELRTVAMDTARDDVSVPGVTKIKKVVVLSSKG